MSKTAARLVHALASTTEQRGCRSCSGKGWLLDTTYDRSGEEVRCTKCYGTGMTQEAISLFLKSKRKARNG